MSLKHNVGAETHSGVTGAACRSDFISSRVALLFALLLEDLLYVFMWVFFHSKNNTAANPADHVLANQSSN